MTTRRLVLPAALAVLFAASGCPAPEDKTPSEEKAGERGKPAATPGDLATLLIGQWKLVKHNVEGLPAGFDQTVEYTRDGRFTLRNFNPLDDRDPIITGAYRLEGATIYRTLDRDPTFKPPGLHIDTVTEEKLVTSGRPRPDQELQVFTFQRLTKK